MKKAHTPLVYITLALILGIAIGPLLGTNSFALLLFFPLAAAAYIWQYKRISPIRQQTFLLTMLAAITSTGACFGFMAAHLPAHHIAHQTGHTLDLQGRVLEAGRTTTYGQKLILECQAPYQGRLLVYLPSSAPLVPHHSIVTTRAKVKPLSQRNPSYTRYLQSQGIHAAANAQHIHIQARETGWQAQLTTFRDRLAHRLQSQMFDSQIAGFAIAMLIGDRTGLDTSIRDSFTATGLNHILSISGMHVALLYLFLNFILASMGRHLLTRHLRTALILMTLLAYMALTGFSPAVCRAVLMLSTLRLAETFFLQTKSINVLALSAFTFLLYDPNLLQDLGFQLSYLAVAGIILLEPPLKAYFTQRLPFLPAMIHASLAMTLAAQIVTTPLVLYHFGQFPAYFLIANLLLLPIVSLATYLGLAALFLCWIPHLGPVIGGLLDTALWITVILSDLIATLPGSVANTLSLNDPGFKAILLQTLFFTTLLYRKELIDTLHPKNLIRLPAHFRLSPIISLLGIALLH